MVLCVLIAGAFFLPLSSGKGVFSLSANSYHLIDIIRTIFSPAAVTSGAAEAFSIPFLISCAGLTIAFIAVLVLFVLTLLQKNIGVRRVMATCILLMSLIFGMQYNTSMTGIAKAGNNVYNVQPEFRLVLKTRAGSVNNWVRSLDKFQAALDEVYTDGKDTAAISAKIDELKEFASGFSYDTKSSVKKKSNARIFAELQSMIPVEKQEAVFSTYFKTLTKSVSAVSSTFGVGYLVIVLLAILLTGTCYSERSKEGYKNNGIYANCMYVGIMLTLFAGALLYPTIHVGGDLTAASGLTKTSLLMVFLMFPKVIHIGDTLTALGLSDGVALVNQTQLLLSVVCFLVSFVCMMIFIVMAARKKSFKLRRIFSVIACLTFLGAGILANIALGDCGIALDGFYYLFAGLSIAAALVPFTAYSDKERYKVFSIVNVILFLLICAFILIPLWKVFVDSVDMTAGYGLRMWPEEFTLLGYKTIVSNIALRRPFMISVLTTISGTLLGLLLSTLGAYVLIQFEMPGRNFLANILLFTMIFNGGMIPTYLVMVNLHLTNTLWSVILLPAINVYNLVLMRNFFEGIPKSLFESAAIDGCSPMGTFVKIVLPLSKAALASIGLMFAVSYWNDYTNYKLYITDTQLYNFQMKLRAMIFSSDMPTAVGVSENTLQNAAIMVAIIPFMIVYPFCQKYFVKGVNIGAVKE